MDASKLIKMRAEAMNLYRSNWQPRDASEVTQIRAAKASAQGCVLNTPTHVGPQTGCCPPGAVRSDAQPGGFSTTWSYDAVRDRKVGGAYCNDSVYGTAGTRVLKTCDEIYAILGRDASGNLLESSKNPVKGATQNCCYSTEVVQRGITGNCEVGPCPPAYTGYMNHVPRAISTQTTIIEEEL
jgi:hypothetical protein